MTQAQDATMGRMLTTDAEAEAEAYLRLFHAEHETLDLLPERLAEVAVEIAETGTYRQTRAELLFGAQVAWRNSTHRIGRLHWPQLA